MSRNVLVSVVFVGLLATQGRFAQAGGVCTCNADLDGNGVVNINDTFIMVNCFGGDCSGCVNSCDIDCDGTVAGQGDLDALECMLNQNNPHLCCPNSNIVPTVSTWGMLALVLFVLVAGTVVFKRVKPAT